MKLNRSARRRKTRDFNNRKTTSIVVHRVGLGSFMKFRKRIQRIHVGFTKSGKPVFKTIVHYDEVKRHPQETKEQRFRRIRKSAK